MPQNLVERAKPSMLPKSIFPISGMLSIIINVVLACTLVEDIWPGLIFWNLSGTAKNFIRNVLISSSCGGTSLRYIVRFKNFWGNEK